MTAKETVCHVHRHSHYWRLKTDYRRAKKVSGTIRYGQRSVEIVPDTIFVFFFCRCLFIKGENMKRMLVAVMTLACAACTPVVTKVSVPDIGKSDAVAVTDMRPASEKERKIFSLMVTSKEYGIWRVGDARLSPSPVRLLQYQIAKQSNGENASPKVEVYHFVVYSNMKSQLTHGAVGAGIGGVAGALIGDAIVSREEMAETSLVDEKAFDGMSADEYQRGLYTQAEDPNKASVYIVYIDTGINGKRVFTRTIASASPKKGAQDPLVTAVQLAIENQLKKYASTEGNSHS